MSRGSTIVGLLVVIVTIGVLAGMVVLAVGAMQSQDKSKSPVPDHTRSSACVAEYRTIQAAEEAYHATTGTYTNVSGLVSARLLANSSDVYDVLPSESTYSITALANNPNGCTAPPG
jgi:general secretion pathway protein G